MQLPPIWRAAALIWSVVSGVLANAPAHAQQQRQQPAPAARGLPLQEALTVCHQGTADPAQVESACTISLGPQGQSGRTAELEGWYLSQRGRARTRLSKFREAVTDFETAIARGYRPHVMQLFIGEAHLLARDTPRATQAFRESARLQPTFVQPRVNLAQVLGNAGQFPAAITELQEALEIALRDTDANAVPLVAIYALLGEYLFRENLLTNARTAIDEAVKRDPSNLPARITQVQVIIAQGDLATAQRLLRGLADSNPRDAAVLASVGLLFMQVRNHQEAFENCVKARQSDENSITALECITLALVNQGSINRAESELKAAEFKSPNNARLLVVLATLQKRRGKLDDSITTFRRALQIDQRLEAARHGLISVLTDRGQLSEAFGEVERALAIDAQDSRALSLRGIAFALSSDPVRAMTDLERVRQLVGDNSDYWLVRGIIQYYLEQTKEAITSLQQSIAKNTSNGEALRFLGRAHIKNRDWAAAQDALARAEQLLPFDWQIGRSRGLLELEQRRFDTAVEFLSKSVNDNPAFVEAYAALGRAYEALRNPQLAETNYRLALARDKFVLDNDGRDARTLAEQRLQALRRPPTPAEPPQEGTPSLKDTPATSPQPTTSPPSTASQPPGGVRVGEIYCGLLQRWSRSSEHYTGVRIGLGCRRR